MSREPVKIVRSPTTPDYYDVVRPTMPRATHKRKRTRRSSASLDPTGDVLYTPTGIRCVASFLRPVDLFRFFNRHPSAMDSFRLVRALVFADMFGSLHKQCSSGRGDALEVWAGFVTDGYIPRIGNIHPEHHCYHIGKEFKLWEGIPNVTMMRLYWSHHFGCDDSMERVQRRESRALIQSLPGEHCVCECCGWCMPATEMNSETECTYCVYRSRYATRREFVDHFRYDKRQASWYIKAKSTTK